MTKRYSGIFYSTRSDYKRCRCIYVCMLNVVASFVDDCRNVSRTLLSERTGYLALYPNSRSNPSSSVGPAACPWILLAQPGERFNVTWRLPSIYHQDFLEYPEPPSGGVASGPSSSSSSAASLLFRCPASWRFVESGDETQYAACVSNLRKPKERNYISKTHRLEIYYTGSPAPAASTSGLSTHKTFRLPVLHYQGFSSNSRFFV